VKYKVIKAFTCKLDHQKYAKGDIYETDDPDRAAFLQKNGRLGAMIEAPPVELPANQEPPAQEPKHIGGGWYELPNGERVKGKDEAYAAMGGD
jgi:hypothetical protein